MPGPAGDTSLPELCQGTCQAEVQMDGDLINQLDSEAPWVTDPPGANFTNLATTLSLSLYKLFVLLAS